MRMLREEEEDFFFLNTKVYTFCLGFFLVGNVRLNLRGLFDDRIDGPT